MSKTPQFDKKLEQVLSETKPGERTCPLTSEKWSLDQEELDWLKKMQVPPSERSPLTRQRIMAGFMIGYQWWWQRHPVTKKPVLTYVHPATRIKVLPDKEWFDQDFSSVNLEYDSSKPVIDQIHKLLLDVPLNATRNTKEPENSIALSSGGDVNSYFNVLTESKNSFFCVWSELIENSADVHNVTTARECYEIDDAARIHNSRYVRDCGNIINSAFAFLCNDCEYCFGVTNWRRKKYILFDKQLSKEEYIKEIKEINLRSRAEVDKQKGKFEKQMAEAIWPEKMSYDDEGSVGEYLYNVRNCRYCYFCVKSSRDMYRCASTAADTHDNAYCLDVINVSDSFSCVSLYKAKSCRFCFSCEKAQNLEYCVQCVNCENCFGCVGLTRKNFYIFNKEYPEDEYWKLVDEIKTKMLETGEYGEFFPLKHSPCYFAQSGAALYFGADEADGKRLGALEYDPESEGAIGEDLIDESKTRSNSEIPDLAEDMDTDDWVGVPIMDEQCGRRFAFLRPEIEFYKKFKIAPPNCHPVYRMQKMIRRANIAVFEEAKCEKCNKDITVAKNLTFPKRRFYCTECYRAYMETR